MLATSSRNLFHRLVLIALCVWAVCSLGRAEADDVKITTPNESVKGTTTEVMGARATPVTLRANILGCLCWADDKGTAFFALDPVGTVRRISFPDLQVTHVIEIGKKCSWISPSAEGPVVSVTESKEVWVLDPSTFSVKKKIPIPGVQRVVSALSLSTAFAVSGRDLHEIDLKKGAASKYAGDMPKLPGYKEQLAVTPDGKYLFVASGFESMHRFGIKDGKAKLEQTSPRISQGRVDIGVQVSPDSRFVTLPCYAGNYTASKYGIFVYPVQNIERPEATVEFGGPCGMAISTDPASGKFYSEGLMVFDKTGKKETEYKLAAGDMKQMLVHPQGGKLLLLGSSKFLLVEIPAK